MIFWSFPELRHMLALYHRVPLSMRQRAATPTDKCLLPICQPCDLCFMIGPVELRRSCTILHLLDIWRPPLAASLSEWNIRSDNFNWCFHIVWRTVLSSQHEMVFTKRVKQEIFDENSDKKPINLSQIFILRVKKSIIRVGLNEIKCILYLSPREEHHIWRI